MALVVFLINVGGQRLFRPSTLVNHLAAFNPINVGAAGTLVIRKPGSRTKLLAALRSCLPFEATIATCDGTDLIQLEAEQPFAAEPPCADQVRFVAVLAEDGTGDPSPPLSIPAAGEWFVRIQGRRGRLVYGVYRRRMKTITYLGQMDRLFGAPAITRSWSTVLSVLRILKSESQQ